MKRPIPFSGLLALSVISTTGTAAAQDLDSRSHAPNRTIVVPGRSLPQAVSTGAFEMQDLNREDLIATGSGRIEDSLSKIAGFQQFRRSDSRSSNPSAQGVTLRALGGNATSRALVLLDGVPLADPMFGYIPFSAIAPERLSGARVTRGGGSGSFGAGALAGTIELSSAGPDMIGNLSAHALINDRAESEVSATLAHQLGGGFAVGSGRWDRGQGFDTTPPDQRVPATARARYDSWSTSLRGVVPLNDTVELQANGLMFEDYRTLRFNGADSSSRGGDASFRIVGRGAWSFDMLGYVQVRNFTNIVISPTRFTPVLDQYDTPSTGIGGKIELRPPVGKNQLLRLGVDYRRSNGKFYESVISAVSGNVTERRIAGGTNSDLGLFAEYDWMFGALTLTAGARADRFTLGNGFYAARDANGAIVNDDRFQDRSGWQGSFRGGAIYALGDDVRLRAAAYTGLRLPTLNELYRGFIVFPVVTQANADLRNERLEGYEVGIDLLPAKGLHVSLTAFDNRVEHAIANVSLAANLRQRQNIDAIHAKGIELGMKIERGIVRLDAALAYTEAVARKADASFDGKRPAQTPAWTAGATLALSPRKDWSLSATLRYVGKQFEDDLETDVLPSAVTVDAYARIPLRAGASLVLRAENLTDENIVTRNQSGSIDLGTPRTFWVGFALKI